MICENCNKCCLCADCVRNKNYAVNTPNPCFCADCDICEYHDMATTFCNKYLTIKELDAIIESRKGA